MGFGNRFSKPNLSEIGAWVRAKASALRARFSKNPASLNTGSEGQEPALSSFEAEVPRRPRLQELTSKIRASIEETTTKIKKHMPRSLEDLKRLDPQEAMEKLRSLGSGGAAGTYLRLGAAAMAAYFLADTVSLFTDALIPDPPPVPAPRVVQKLDKKRSVDDFAAITSRHIFNSKGLMPEEEGQDLAGGPARKSSLPLTLIGTVVLKNELKSIAAIEDKSLGMVFPVRIEDTIEDKLRITKIEHLRVEFVNKSTGHLEYIEIVEDLPTLGTQSARQAPTPAAGAKQVADGVSQTDETHYQVERNAIDRAMGNINDLLQQARAIPNFEQGLPDGYRILQIQPGSLFEKLGVRNNDIITGLNGETVNDPGKAFQAFNELRTASHVEITVKRNGRKMNLNYDLR